jgi:hypothetical protein
MAYPTLSQELETITPDKARRILTSNTNNRPIKTHKLLAIKKDLRSGNFRLTHQGIALDWNGNLIDGQHRLTAIAETGVTVQMYVTRNCDPTIFKVIDTGAVRSPSDVLKTMGSQYYSTVSSGIRLILWAHNRYEIASSAFNKSYKKAFTVSNSEISSFFSAEPVLIQALAGEAKKLRAISPIILPSAAVAFLYLVEEAGYDVELGYDFLHRTASGSNLPNGSVELALGRFLALKHIDFKGWKKGEYMLAVFIKAFNKYLRGEHMLQFRLGNVDPLPFIEKGFEV